jgi:hypothetical protein
MTTDQQTAPLTARVVDQSWGWVVRTAAGQSTCKLANRVAAQAYADAINAGETREAAWDRLQMSRWVRTQDGGSFDA